MSFYNVFKCLIEFKVLVNFSGDLDVDPKLESLFFSLLDESSRDLDLFWLNSKLSV